MARGRSQTRSAPAARSKSGPSARRATSTTPVTRGGKPTGQTRRRSTGRFAKASSYRTASPSRSRSIPVQSGTEQFTQVSAKLKLGKAITPAKQLQRMEMGNRSEVILRWNALKPFNSTGTSVGAAGVGIPGYYGLFNTLGSTYANYPMYMYDLTMGINGPVSPMLQLNEDIATSNFYWSPVGHVQPDATLVASSEFIETSTSSNTAANILAPQAYLSWASINMNCWGQTARETKYIIQVVQFTDADLVPLHASGGLSGGNTADLTQATAGSVDVYQRRNDVFGSIVKPLTYNPLAQTGTGLNNKRMKILKSMSFVLQPNSTTDGDSDANCKTVKMFLELNKMLKYTERAASAETTAGIMTADVPLNVNNQTVSSTKQVLPRSRIYLVIRSSNYARTAAGSVSQANTPSFDLVVRKKFQLVQ